MDERGYIATILGPWHTYPGALCTCSVLSAHVLHMWLYCGRCLWLILLHQLITLSPL